MNATNTTNLEGVIFYGLIIAGGMVAIAIVIGCALVALALSKRNR